MSLDYPILEEEKTILTKHNHNREDNFYWIQEKNKRRKVIKHLKKENEFSDNLMKGTKTLQKELFNEFKSRTKENYTSIPSYYKGFFYYNDIKKGEDYKKYYRKKTLKSKPELFLDCMKLSKDKEFFELGHYEISHDNKSLLYCVDTDGNEKYELYLKNIETGKIQRELKKEIEADFVWKNLNEFYYVTADDSKRPSSIWKHTIGTDEKNDVLIYEETDVLYTVDLNETNDEKYILISIGSTTTSEYYYIDDDDKIKLIQKRVKNHMYSVEHNDGYFYMLTNKDKSTNFKITKTKVNQTKKSKWVDFIPYNKNTYITEMSMFKDYLVLDCKVNGQYIIKVITLSNKSIKVIKYENVYNIAVEGNLNLDFESNKLRYSYSSLISPKSFYEYNMNTTDEKVLRKISYKNYNSKLYESKRLLVDEKIWLYMSIVYKKSEFKKDGTNKGHLYAYGSYGYDVDVDYDKYIISLLDRGYVYAIAHVRGSSYLGKNWYESGKLMKKKNTFNDFIKCSQFLIKNNYVSADGLSISGGSAGGLLIGNVVNKKPSLYKSAILDVPFVDCLTTMLDSSLPLTTGEYLEWGNPEKSKTVYKYMLSYSPIDNIKDQKYPNILITTGINDTRVAFWEPVKYCAKMRKVVSSFKKDDRDIMMKIDLNAGHGGASGRYQYMKDEAFKYAFLIKYT